MNFKLFPKTKISIQNILFDLFSEIDSKRLELSLNSITMDKDFKDIEIVEMGRKSNRRTNKTKNNFDQKWTCESMCAYERTCLVVAINNTELKR